MYTSRTPIPHPPRPPRRTARAVILGVAGAALFWTVVALAASGDRSGTGTAPSSAPSAVAGAEESRPAEEPRPVEGTPATDLTRRELTRLSIEAAWSQLTEADMADMCVGVIIYGTDWVADQMRAGAADSTMDWDYAAVLVEEKCASL